MADKKTPKKQPEITVSSMLKKMRRKKAVKNNTASPSKRNLPSAELHRESAVSPEFAEHNYISEEEALGPAVQNEAYLVLARRYRLCRWGIVALLLLFLLFMFNLFREEITIENFRYLIRNVNFELKTEIDEEGAILYDSDEQNAFALYKSSLAVANSTKLTIYDTGGRSSCTVQLDYTSPALKASDQYVLAYDRADGDYSLYTSFSQMHIDSTGYPISDADITDDGVYAIASRSKDYFGVVTICNSDFKMIGKIQKNKYIASIDLSPDGSSIAIASYYSGESGYITELMTLKVDSDEPDLLFTVENTFPYKVQWTEEGEFFLCADNGIKFFNKDGKVYNEYTFLGQNVIKYSVDASGAAIVTGDRTDSDRSMLILIDAKGKETGRFTLEGVIESIDRSGNTVVLTSASRAWKIEKGVLYCADADRHIQKAIVDGEELRLCGYTQVLAPEWKKVS